MKLFLFIILIFNLNLVMEINAQSVCVPKEYTVSAIRGKVVTKEEEFPFPNISVKLINEREEDKHKKTVAVTETDENGSFEFSQIKSGKYLIFVEPLGHVPFGVRVNFVKPKKVKKSTEVVDNKQEIILLIGSESFKACGGSYSEIRSTEQ